MFKSITNFVYGNLRVEENKTTSYAYKVHINNGFILPVDRSDESLIRAIVESRSIINTRKTQQERRAVRRTLGNISGFWKNGKYVSSIGGWESINLSSDPTCNEIYFYRINEENSSKNIIAVDIQGPKSPSEISVDSYDLEEEESK